MDEPLIQLEDHGLVRVADPGRTFRIVKMQTVSWDEGKSLELQGELFTETVESPAPSLTRGQVFVMGGHRWVLDRIQATSVMTGPDTIQYSLVLMAFDEFTILRYRDERR